MIRFFITLIIISSSLTACNNSISTSRNASSSFYETTTFGIRSKPILNREYLIYLAWTYDVYAQSYPERFNYILPYSATKMIHSAPLHLEHILVDSKPLLRDYILNPKYLDYPVVGLSHNQMLEMGQWLHDRYNENQLIERGHLNFNPAQLDEDCFTFEAFMSEQYMGSVRNDQFPKWQDNVYMPNFRLPHPHEVEAIQNQKDFSNQLTRYSFGPKDFLWRWNEHYLNVEKDQLTFKLTELLTIPRGKDSDLVGKNCTSALLDHRWQEFSDTEYFISDFSESYPYQEKNKFGQMEFVIIGQDEQSRPVVGKRIIPDDRNKVTQDIFRIAFSKTIEKKYRLLLKD